MGMWQYRAEKIISKFSTYILIKANMQGATLLFSWNMLHGLILLCTYIDVKWDFCIIDAVYVGLRISGLTLLDHVSTHIQYTVYTIQYISHNLMVCMQHSLRLVRRDKNWNQLTSGLSRASFNRLSKRSTATLNVSESIWFGSDTASATATACSTTGNCREVIITPKLSLIYTGEPLNKGYYGANDTVPCREVVPTSEIK